MVEVLLILIGSVLVFLYGSHQALSNRLKQLKVENDRGVK